MVVTKSSKNCLIETIESEDILMTHMTTYLFHWKSVASAPNNRIFTITVQLDMMNIESEEMGVCNTLIPTIWIEFFSRNPHVWQKRSEKNAEFLSKDQLM